MPASKVPASSAVESAPASVGKGKSSAITCVSGAGVAGLSMYVGKNVEAICPFGYGRTGDSENHCAHFVSHALNISLGTTCAGLLPWKLKGTDPVLRSSVSGNRALGLYTLDGKERVDFKGACTRVNEIYNSIGAKDKGDWDARPDPGADCLMFATIPDNISKDRGTMNNLSRKHVGIHTGGTIYNYGNTKDAVVDDSIEAFQKKFRQNYGKDVVFLWGKIPDTTGFCVHAG